MIFKFIKIRGFTLIELMVVIGVIAILSTLAFVFFNTVRMNSRDARRLADVKQIQNALKMYYNDVGFYPTAITANGSIANGSTNYLLRIPSNPAPRADNGCIDQDYQYTQLENGQRYSLSFCLGDKTDEYDSGNHGATANGILNCPTGYVAVPGSSEFNTNDFCVMKYEAKCVNTDDVTVGMLAPATVNNTYATSHGGGICAELGAGSTIASVSSGYPMAMLPFSQAKAYCQHVGAHLITNDEWMTIVRNAENVANATDYFSNWESGVVGSGSLPRGILNGDLAVEASYEWSDDCRPCTDELAVLKRRTLVLSNRERIWDIAGNVSEWVDGSCVTDVGNDGGIGEYYNSGGYIEWDNANLNDYERSIAGPSNSSWSASGQGIGQYYGCTTGTTGFLRGGDASGIDVSGIYALRLNQVSTDINPLVGFRCVKD